MRIDLSGSPSFREYLARVHEMVLGALEHQDYPFALLVEKLKPDRDTGRSPVFQVMFSLQKQSTLGAIGEFLEKSPDVSDNDTGTLKLMPFVLDQGEGQFDILLELIEKGINISGVLNFNTDLFDTSTIARMAGHFKTLIGGIVEDPDCRITKLPILKKAERRQILVEWNNTGSKYPEDKCLHQLFEAQAENTPGAAAVIFKNQEITYKKLNNIANRLANRLRSLGVGPDIMVGICIERSPEMITGLLGILKAGGAYVPLDAGLPGDRLAFIMNDTKIQVLLTQKKMVSKLPETKAKVLFIDEDRELISKEDVDNPESGARPENLVYVIYTSGSTGRPKGVMVVHRGLVNYLNWCIKVYAAAEGVGAPVHSSLGFDATVTSLFAPLLTGRKVVMLPEEQTLEALSKVLFSDMDFSFIKITPAHLDLLNRIKSGIETQDNTRLLIIGGEALYCQNLSLWRSHTPKTRIINEYGPTETVVGSCYHEVSDRTPLSGAVPIGRPIANTQIYILDNYNEPVPVGVTGEIHVGGAGLARGYLNQPGLTKQKFVPNPFSDNPGDRLYKAGDQGRYLPGGNIEYIGRKDFQVKIRGYRIEPGEVETVLGRHPAVEQAVIIAREDKTGDKYLAAYIISNSVKPPSFVELRSFLREKLPEYMVPRAFVILDSFPLLPNGKLDRKLLPVPDLSASGQEKGYAAPGTPTEEILEAIWRELLGLDKVSVNDDFFMLGGHSLKANILSLNIHKELDVQVPLTEIFEKPTIRALAGYIDRSGKCIYSGIETVVQKKYYRQSSAQKRLFIFNELQGENVVYNIPIVMIIEGKLDKKRFAKSFETLIKRHESLRTSFDFKEGEPVQIIRKDVDFQLYFIKIEEDDLKTAAQNFLKPFVLTEPPLIRVCLAEISEEKHAMFLDMHHIISDGVSIAVLFRELADLYEGTVLPGLRVQYKDFSLWKHRVYWAKGLSGKNSGVPD